MRVAAMVIGILGAIAAFMGACTVTVGGGIADAFGAEEGAEIAGRGAIGWVASIVALVGAAMALSKPRVAAILLAVGAIVGLIVNGVFFIPGAVLLGVATLLAFFGRNEKEKAEAERRERWEWEREQEAKREENQSEA